MCLKGGHFNFSSQKVINVRVTLVTIPCLSGNLSCCPYLIQIKDVFDERRRITCFSISLRANINTSPRTDAETSSAWPSTLDSRHLLYRNIEETDFFIIKSYEETRGRNNLWKTQRIALANSIRCIGQRKALNWRMQGVASASPPLYVSGSFLTGWVRRVRKTHVISGKIR